MKQEIWGCYCSCPRFDESVLRNSEEFSRIAAMRMTAEKLLLAMFGPQALPLLEEYTSALYGEMELEARHFFEQGYLANSTQHS